MALYESLIRMRNLPELASFRTMLDDELAKETAMMVGLADDKAMWRAQGACRMMIKLKNLIEDSKSVLEKPRPSNVTGILSSNSP